MTQALAPLAIQPSSVRVPRAFIAAGSEPAWASLRQYPPSQSPPTIRGSRSARWAALPKPSTGPAVRVCTLTPSATLAQRMASSSTTCRYTS